MNERITLMGCSIDNLTMEETLQTVEGFIHSGRPHQHVVVNVDKLVKASRDPELRRIINDCALVNVDGMPVVWASRLLGRPLKERVAGCDLFEALMRRAGEKGWRVFLLGAKEEVVSKVASTYRHRYPNLMLAGGRGGGKSVAALMSEGKTVLTRADVMDGVAELVPEIQVEATFPDGTKLVTVHQPIA